MKQHYSSDKTAMAFLILAMSYLLLGMGFGVLGAMQYLLPPFLREQLSFQKMRPLHVYLVIAWIFTAAQGCIYYFIPRIAGRPLVWGKGAQMNLWLQLVISGTIVICFFTGRFSGREYLEFPAWIGAVILLSWIPFALNFFGTIRPDYRSAPVYIWSWSAGILFFFITVSESYLWLLDYFNNNIVRDVTVQWKALGSMVGSWNMLVYGSSMFIMEKLGNDPAASRKKIPFFFFFLGLTNLMFNWGHHTYIVPASAIVKSVAYIISMTELLILGYIIFKWKKTVSNARTHFSKLSYRLLSIADGWIFLNLSLAILISIPALNFYTHGTHVTVAHAMGATIGINTMLLLGVIFYVIQQERPFAFDRLKHIAGKGILITNIALIIFWVSLLGMGAVKIFSRSAHEAFSLMMKKSEPLFKLFSLSGGFIMLGIGMTLAVAIKMITQHKVLQARLRPERHRKSA